MSAWTVSGPESIDIDEQIREVQVSLIDGAIDVVATDGPARVEISELDGPELQVTVEDGVLRVTYDDFRWDKSIVFSLGHKRFNHKRRAVVSVAVPEASSIKVGVVSADATVAGLSGAASINTVSSGVVLDQLTGTVDVKTVSGYVEMRHVVGDCRINSVSGNLSVVDGEPKRFSAKSVSGDITMDIVPAFDPDIDLISVSGDVTVRLPNESVGTIDCMSASGHLSSTLGDIVLDRKPGKLSARRNNSSVAGALRAKTVSGDIALVTTEPSTPAPETATA